MEQHTEPGPDMGGRRPLGRAEARWQRREQRRAARGGRYGGGWLGGLVLIAVGVLLMLRNAGAVALGNWWGLVILVPALGAIAASWRAYQQAGGRLNAAARRSMIGGLVLILVAAAVLFEMNWASVGPVLIILAGIGLLLNVALPG